MVRSGTTAAEEPDPLPGPGGEPPPDRFCDLILNGGVASGVVYPWALIELARHYRFHSIGGNSVGAVAGVLAAAAEYGRCRGVEGAFEPLRRAPLDLAAEDAQGRAGMLRLFQPPPQLRRLFDAFVALVRVEGGPRGWLAVLRRYLRGWPLPLVVAWLLWIGFLMLRPGAPSGSLLLAGIGSAMLMLLAALVGRLLRDLRELVRHNYGLCQGRGLLKKEGGEGEEGLLDWLHRGVQRSAGRRLDDPPLCFADLWHAPRSGSVPPASPDGGMPASPSIRLEMFSSVVTLGRPVRLPLADSNLRLFFLPDEWKALLPAALFKGLMDASLTYCPMSPSDPPVDDRQQAPWFKDLRELPGARMPIVVAARLSLSFPLLFCAIPVYAIDYEAPRGQRRLRRCWLSDGGLCTNFPIHLFDAAHPRWPTFGLFFDRRLRSYGQQPIWLAPRHGAGRGDNWQRDMPDVHHRDRRNWGRKLAAFGLGLLLTSKDWNDRMTGRLPHVRTRMVRLMLRPGEGELNIAMSGAMQLRLARDYGMAAGRRLVKRFLPRCGVVRRAWREHLYVRAMSELQALHRHLRGYSSATRTAHPERLSLGELLRQATLRRPLAGDDLAGDMLTPTQAQALGQAAEAVSALEQALEATEPLWGPYEPNPKTELRLRPPI